MHVFDYKERPEKLLTPEVVNQIGKLHELKGRQDVHRDGAGCTDFSTGNREDSVNKGIQ